MIEKILSQEVRKMTKKSRLANLRKQNRKEAQENLKKAKKIAIGTAAAGYLPAAQYRRKKLYEVKKKQEQNKKD